MSEVSLNFVFLVLMVVLFVVASMQWRKSRTLSVATKILQGALQEKNESYSQLERCYSEESVKAEQEKAQLLNEAKILQGALQEKNESYSQLERRYSEESLRAAHEKARLLSELKLTLDEKILIGERFDLVRKILDQKPVINHGLSGFSRLIRDDYVDFLACTLHPFSGIKSFLDLQLIHRDLDIAIRVPVTLGKTVLGVSGGFSSGKSAFINNFLPSDSVRLAVGINPVTVIPSYIVTSARGVKIHGHCANGGSVNIDASLYKKLSHEYAKSFGFDLRSVMPFISVQVPLDNDLFGNIAIIDTPGYNPGSDGLYQAFDRAVAAEYINQCDALIWVINIKDGTLPASDGDFLEQLGFSGEKLYIVLNQADLLPSNDIRDVIEEVSNELDFSGIKYSGICAYSSVLKRHYGTVREDLFDFIKRNNVLKNEIRKIKENIELAFSRHNADIAENIRFENQRKNALMNLGAYALERGGTEEYQRMKPLLVAIEEAFPKRDLKSESDKSRHIEQVFFSYSKDALKHVWQNNQ